ncbi:MAG: YciI family protein [Armatimonadota bacterium]
MPQFLLELGLNRPDMMQGPSEDEMSLVVQHYAYWEVLSQTGKALVVGRTQDDRPNGYAIFLAENEEHAQLIAENDPAVGKVFSYVVRPYKVSLLGDPAAFKP